MPPPIITTRAVLGTFVANSRSSSPGWISASAPCPHGGGAWRATRPSIKVYTPGGTSPAPELKTWAMASDVTRMRNRLEDLDEIAKGPEVW